MTSNAGIADKSTNSLRLREGRLFEESPSF